MWLDGDRGWSIGRGGWWPLERSVQEYGTKDVNAGFSCDLSCEMIGKE